MERGSQIDLFSSRCLLWSIGWKKFPWFFHIDWTNFWLSSLQRTQFPCTENIFSIEKYISSITDRKNLVSTNLSSQIQLTNCFQLHKRTYCNWFSTTTRRIGNMRLHIMLRPRSLTFFLPNSEKMEHFRKIIFYWK